MLSSKNGVLFGAAYYHEYQPSPRLETDMDLMKEAGFTVIRVGESVWSTWEPEDGVFDLDWLQPVLDAAQERGIDVILGTPTYAVPMWLARKHPEIAGERRTGERIGWGARQEMDNTHPAYLFYAERIIRRVISRYADHPAVIGYQVDNEPGLELLHNRGVFQRFVDELRHQYGDVESLNEAWGLVYWSHRLSTWADLWTPDNNAQPQYDLAWRRFQAKLTNEFIEWQANIVREIAHDGQFVMCDVAYSRPGIDDPELNRPLDITAGNPYYAMQDSFDVQNDGGGEQGWTTRGAWTLYKSGDRMYSSKQDRFLVTETNAGAIGGPQMNSPAYDGQWRQAGWAFVSRGAQLLEYWHWHTLHYGTETYWIGILPHDQEPGRVYRELATLGNELITASDHLKGLTPTAEVAFLWSNASKWGLAGQPALAKGPAGDVDSYEKIFDPFYRGVFEAGGSAQIIHDTQLLEEGVPRVDPASFVETSPTLVAPALYIASDELLDWLLSYAEAGGHLVLGPRSAYADTEARARLERKPARLADAAGVRYQEFSNVNGSIPVEGAALSGAATEWIDGLIEAEGEVLARYGHPHFQQFPAIVSRAVGKGRITTVGGVPDRELARSIGQWLLPDVVDPWRALCQGSVRVTSATSDTSRLRFVHNWGWDESTITLPERVEDILSGERLDAQVPLTLKSWDVRVLRVAD